MYERWLPARGLGRGCPALLGRAAERRGAFIWHVSEDLGDRHLVTDPPDENDLAIAVGFLARMHVRFASHPMLAEARTLGGDLGLHFFSANVADAFRGLRALRQQGGSSPPGRAAACDRLIDRLEDLQSSLPRRAAIFRAHAGSETLLHGDLWTTNVLVAEDGTRVCLIDWDHAGAGPASYDISTFLLRFPAEHRAHVLERYRHAVAAEGGSVAPPAALEVLFETAELARYANRVSWLALVLLDGGNEWAWERMETVEGWFRSFRGVVECRAAANANGPTSGGVFVEEA